jgi:hypothetical protein
LLDIIRALRTISDPAKEKKMSFSTRSIEDLARIVMTGGGLRMDAGAMSTDDLARLAMLAKGSGARLTLTGMSHRAIDDLARIGMVGKPHVVFED